jgi:hypothetical protein
MNGNATEVGKSHANKTKQPRLSPGLWCCPSAPISGRDRHRRYCRSRYDYSRCSRRDCHIRSRRLNDEVVLGIQDPQLAKSLHDVFQKDLLRSKAIKLDDWKRRGPVQRILEILSQAFVQQY